MSFLGTNATVLNRRALLHLEPSWRRRNSLVDFLEEHASENQVEDSYDFIEHSDFENLDITPTYANYASDVMMHPPEVSGEVEWPLAKSGTSMAIGATAISQGVSSWQKNQFNSTMTSELQALNADITSKYNDLTNSSKWSFETTDANRFKSAGEAYYQQQQQVVTGTESRYNTLQSGLDVARTGAYAVASAFGGVPVLGVAAVDFASRFFMPSAPEIGDVSDVKYTPVQTYGVWADPEIDNNE